MLYPKGERVHSIPSARGEEKKKGELQKEGKGGFLFP